MALNETPTNGSAGRATADAGARRWMVGTNVVLMTILALAVAGAVQYGGYQAQNRLRGSWDWTSAHVNRLTDSTENLLKRLDKKVWITSLYFQSDEEREDQAQYRTRTHDLINLYQLGNRTQVEVEFINPVKDHERMEALLKRLADIPKYRDESAKHAEVAQKFREDLAPRLSKLIETEQSSASTLAQTLGDQKGEVLGQIVERVLPQVQAELVRVQEGVSDDLSRTPPRYSAAVPDISQFYTTVNNTLNQITTVGPREMASMTSPPPQLAEFFNSAKERYRETTNALNEAITLTQNLPRLEFDELVSEIQRGAKSNPLVVNTADGASVIAFETVWPPINPDMPPNAVGVKERDFRGEEKLTSAILKLTSKDKTAVVFVRYAGQPLFGMGSPFGGGMPRGPMMLLKEHLEAANFQVEEWDLATQPAQPPVNPAPKRTIFVVLKPQAPPHGMPQQQGQIPFGEFQQQTLRSAVENAGRAIFLAGWSPMQGFPGAVMADRYEFAPYLKDNWGIEVDSQHLILEATPIAPGKFIFRPGAQELADYQLSSHPTVKGMSAYRALFPLAAPLKLADKPPEGVQLEKLAWTPPRDDLWGVGDLQKYQEQRAAEFVQKLPEDPLGPFTLAAVASKGDKKIAVVSARAFVDDQVALQPELVVVGGRLATRLRNPGNVTLFINLLHWLNDNTEWMNVGRPIASAVLDIEPGPKLRFFRTLVFAIWPAVALACGGLVYWVRRR